MNFKFTTSITAKLFYLMTGLVLAVVIGMTVQSSSKFKRFLTQNVQDGSQSQADRAAQDVSTYLNSIASKISVAVPRLNLTGENGNASQEIITLMKNDPEVIAASVFFTTKNVVKQIVAEKSPYPSNGYMENRYGSKSPDDVKLLALYIEKHAVESYAAAPKSSATQVRSINQETKLPLMLVTLRFDIESQPDTKVFVSLAMWQTRILVTLPKSRSTESSIIDQTGRIFASTESFDDQKALSKKNTDLVQTAIARTAPSGFQDVYEDSSGRRKLGAYSQIPGYNNLYAIVEKDAEAAFLAITRNYYSATLWALLFTFMAILLSFVGAGSATRSIRDLVTVTREIASGNFTARALPRSKDEIAELGTSVNHMAGRITALLSNEVEKARYEKELETARMVQSTFFPKQDVRLGPLTATGYYQPATECGGDLWGHYKVDEHRQLLFIADVMGHGAPAALVTAIGYAICQAVASILVDEPNLNSSPSKLLERLNMIIYDAVEGKISMTFFAAMLDFSTGVMTYANAGHNFPVIMTRNPDDARVGKAAKAKPASAYIIPLQLQGTPLGIDRAAEFKEKQTSICAGDLIFLFTDGLIENQLPEGKPMGRKNLIEMLAQWGDQDCFGVKKSALDAATALFGSTNLNDDVTIVVAEIDKNWSKGDSAIETTLVTANNA